MTKVHLISFSGIGAVALSPFSLLIPRFIERNKSSNKDPLIFDKEVATNLQIHSSKRENGPLTNNLDNSQGTVSEVNSQKSNIISPSPAPKAVIPKVSQDISPDVEQSSEKPDLSKWLESISPLFAGGGINKPLTIVARWNGGYSFVIVRWIPECKCFRQLDSNYGIWSNYAGYFTIDHKNANELSRQKNSVTKPECKDLYGFWYQEWHTWWKLSRWIRSFENGDNHIAIASCYKEPVIFLKTGFNIPVFLSASSSKNPWNIKIPSYVNIAWSYKEKEFVTFKDTFKRHLNVFLVKNYGDWKRLFRISTQR